MRAFRAHASGILTPRSTPPFTPSQGDRSELDLRRGRDVIGMTVVETGSNRALGSVVDLLIAPDGRVGALVVSSAKGIFRKAFPVPITAFDSLEGGQAHIPKARLVEWKDAEIEGMTIRGERTGLVGMALVTDEGKDLGTIADVILDGAGVAKGGDCEAPADAAAITIWGFEVSDGIVKDLLDGRPVVEAAGAFLKDGAVVLGRAREHMNLAAGGHATSEGSE